MLQEIQAFGAFLMLLGLAVIGIIFGVCILGAVFSSLFGGSF